MDNVTTTAIYPNRRADKMEVEGFYKLPELGNDTTKFYLNSDLFAYGYNRIVYGDHGPYIEYERYHIKIELLSKFGGEIDYEDIPDNPRYYYVWMYPIGYYKVKVYFQLKTVKNLPNAPKRNDGKPSRFNRKEGYADYRISKFYVDPHSFKRSEIKADEEKWFSEYTTD